MQHIDITFDLETVATTSNAAVMQIAAAAWCRDAKEDPFDFSDSGFFPSPVTFNEHIDLRTCVMDGFDFDQDTVKWWSERSDVAKRAVLDGQGMPIKDAFAAFFEWMDYLIRELHAESVCLWCQGMDFDASILRNVCRKYDMKMPFPFRSFRDCRTVILEAAVAFIEKTPAEQLMKSTMKDCILDATKILADPRRAYTLYDKLPEKYEDGSAAHDALYDAIRSSWNTWQALKWFRSKKDLR